MKLTLRNAFEYVLKGPKMKQLKTYFTMLEGYSPVFSTYDGGVYEMELTRTCIHSFATHASKLQPHVEGPDLRGLQAILDHKPNPFMTSAQFLYKCATLYEAKNTLLILPILDKADRVVGYYPANYSLLEVMEVEGSPEPWIRVTFNGGQTVAYELSRCGLCSKYLYNSDLVGEDNTALGPTMQLLHMQAQGIEEGIKNSATFRFMANVNNFSTSKDLKNERKRFVEENFGPDSGGLALFPNTYSNIKQVVSSPRVVDPEQMRIIQERVFDYFGTNIEILQNKSVGDAWSAYYEGKVEPFAIQLSQAMTCMTYSELERARRNAVVWSANRLQYMTNTDKLQVSSQMFDRGILSTNNIMDIWNLPHVEDGDKRYIRKEYTEISQLDQVAELQKQLADAKAQQNLPQPPAAPGEPAEKEDGENADPAGEN